jgi:urea transport system ATP-binding protein
MLTVQNLHVGYGQSEVLHGLDFTVAPAEIIVVVGRNGMGKTTLMKSLIGMIPITAGHVRLGDVELTKLPTFKRVAQGLAYVPQGRMIFPAMTVQENIETGLFVHNTPKIQPDIYELFPVLKDMRARRGGNLSGGQQQQQPSIILELARTLRRIRDERGLSIIASEQVLSFALDIADRVLVIEGGNIVHQDVRADVDEAMVARYLAV